MSRSKFQSVVSVPEFENSKRPALLDFLIARFPRISRDVWIERIAGGMVTDGNGVPLSFDTVCIPGSRICYFREVETEPVIPWQESIIFQNSEILIADKPHFLPVIPGGPYVNESLLNRLRSRLGITDLTPVHRIDRDTAGLVMFSKEKGNRGLYQKLFMDGKIRKSYLAVVHWLPEKMNKYEVSRVVSMVSPEGSSDKIEDSSASPAGIDDLTIPGARWRIRCFMTSGEPWFRMKVSDSENPNSETEFEVINIIKDGYALLRMFPSTGRKHQLRLHLSHIGCKIVNDRFYPDLFPDEPPDFQRPLKLLAQRLQFTDPVSGTEMDFVSSYSEAFGTSF